MTSRRLVEGPREDRVAAGDAGEAVDVGLEADRAFGRRPSGR